MPVLICELAIFQNLKILIRTLKFSEISFLGSFQFLSLFLLVFSSSSLLTISSSSTNEKRARVLYLEKDHNDEIGQASQCYITSFINHPTSPRYNRTLPRPSVNLPDLPASSFNTSALSFSSLFNKQG